MKQDSETTLRALLSGQLTTLAGDRETLIVQPAATVARANHILQVLKAIRNVNQLIVSEQDPLRLIQRACENLTETMGYFNAWIALFGESTEHLTAVSHSGFGREFEEHEAALSSGGFPSCFRRALRQDETIVVVDPASECLDCALSTHYSGRAGLCRRLLHEGKTYGVMAVSVPAAFSGDAEEHELFEEVCEDLAFALYRIEASNQLTSAQRDLRHAQALMEIGAFRLNLFSGEISSPDTTRELFGLRAGTLTLSQVLSMILPPHREIFNEALEALISRGDPFDLEFEFLRPSDGAVRTVRSVAELDQKNQIVFGTVQDITELHQREQRIRLLGSMLDVAPAAITIHTMEGRFLFANQEALRLHDYDHLEEFLSINLHDLDVPESERLLKERFEKILQNGEARFESSHYRKDRTCFPMEVMAKLLTWDGQPAVLSIATDITDKKAIESALRESEERNRLLSDLTFEGILLHSKGVAIDLNQALANMVGCPRESLIGQDFIQFISEEDRPMVREMMALEVASPYIARMITHHGKTIFVEIQSRNFLKADQRWRVSSIRDVSGQRRAEEELRRRDNQLEKIFEILPIGLWFSDQNGKLLRGNPEGVRIWGAEPHVDIADYGIFKARRLPSGQPLGPDDWALAKTIRQKITILDELLEIEAFDGKKRTILNYSTPLLDERGEIEGAIVVNLDISDRASLEDQLQQAQKMESVGRLAGGVAHDFNNMLGIILGFSELSLEKLDALDPLAHNLREIHRAAKKSTDITRQLLAFARKQAITPQVLNLNEVLESMLSMLRRLIGENIDLTWRPDDGLWSVMMDPSQVDQVLANLCVNARDAINGVGKILIETGNLVLQSSDCTRHFDPMEGEFVQLTVSDNGCGMDEHTMENLFEPFFTTKDQGKGTGLGLATVYGIIKQNNGCVRVESEPNRGTTFRILLPRYKGTRKKAPTADGRPIPTGNQETIFIVEDDSSIMKLSRIMLERLKYKVLTFDSPVEALAFAEHHPERIDLLLTDVIMPEMNGRDMAQRMVRTHPELKILFMSGYTADIIAHHGVIDEGMAFIHKPFSMKELALKLHDMLQPDTSAPNRRG